MKSKSSTKAAKPQALFAASDAAMAKANAHFNRTQIQYLFAVKNTCGPTSSAQIAKLTLMQKIVTAKTGERRRIALSAFEADLQKQMVPR